MDIELLRTFVAVVDSGGFTRAGNRVQKTQSSISQQVARLEQHVGRALLKRDTRKVTLTEHGEQYLSYARRILALEQEARTVVRAGEQITFLRLGIPEDFTLTRLSAILGRFAARNRDVRLEVVSALSPQLKAQFAEGQLDIIVVKEPEPTGPALLRWKERLTWVVKSDTALHRQRPVPLVAFPHGCFYRCRATAALDAVGSGWRIAYESANWAGIKAAVEGGLGVALLADVRGFRGVRELTAQDEFPPLEPVYLVLRTRETPPRGAAAEIAKELAQLIPEERPVVAV
ncbi:MAG TPA: LysR substrate-binding domain-containing protein [Stellaceae bacterium]|nr:LysR substrate-binding domain-containing protein [Stellaceae bacterium]